MYVKVVLPSKDGTYRSSYARDEWCVQYVSSVWSFGAYLGSYLWLYEISEDTDVHGHLELGEFSAGSELWLCEVEGVRKPRRDAPSNRQLWEGYWQLMQEQESEASYVRIHPYPNVLWANRIKLIERIAVR